MRVIDGVEVQVPVPRGTGTMGDRTRWILIRDGLRSVIEYLPEGQRMHGTRLGEIWAYADGMCRAYAEGSGQWPNLL